MEKEANQLYRRPQMTGQARDGERFIIIIIFFFSAEPRFMVTSIVRSPLQYGHLFNMVILAQSQMLLKECKE